MEMKDPFTTSFWWFWFGFHFNSTL